VFDEWRADAAPTQIKTASHPPFTHLLSVRRLRAVMNSFGIQLPEIRRRHPFNAAYIHPLDLEALGLGDGSEIEVIADNGIVPAIAQADETMRRGVVSMSHCWGGLPDEDRAYTENGSSTNILVGTDDCVETINAMPRMSSIPIRIRARTATAAAPSGKAPGADESRTC
jgi:anaerobic selenocysteine-containing dehydrogenase